jgi:hypothetical protein
MSAADELLPIPPQPEISEGNKTFHQKAYDLYKWLRTKHGPALIETVNLMRNAVTGAFTATSSTSMEITVGEKSLEISLGRSFVPGTPARVAYKTDPTKYIDGITKSYDPVTGDFVFDGVTPNGAGTFTDWSISIIPSSAGGLASLFTNKFTGLQSFANEATVASATTLDLTAAGSNQIKLTGAVDIVNVTMPQGAVITARTASTPKLKNSATLIVQGGEDYTCAAGDILIFIKDGDGNVRVSIFNLKTALNDSGFTSNDNSMVSSSWVKGLFKIGTPVIANGASAFDFTIPAGAKRLGFLFNNISTNGSSFIIAQAIVGGSPVTSGYRSAIRWRLSEIFGSSGFIAFANTSNGATLYGLINLIQIPGNNWIFIASIGGDVSGTAIQGDIATGAAIFSGAVQGIRITVGNGTDLFDSPAGTITPVWEF